MGEIKQGINKEISEDDRILAEDILRFLRDPQRSKEYQELVCKRTQEFSFEQFHENVIQVLEK